MGTSTLIEIIYANIPYSNQIKNLKISERSIYFEWRGECFKVEESGMTMTSRGSILEGSNSSMLMEHIIKKAKIEYEIRKANS